MKIRSNKKIILFLFTLLAAISCSSLKNNSKINYINNFNYEKEKILVIIFRDNILNSKNGSASELISESKFDSLLYEVLINNYGFNLAELVNIAGINEDKRINNFDFFSYDNNNFLMPSMNLSEKIYSFPFVLIIENPAISVDESYLFNAPLVQNNLYVLESRKNVRLKMKFSLWQSRSARPSVLGIFDEEFSCEQHCIKNLQKSLKKFASYLVENDAHR